MPGSQDWLLASRAGFAMLACHWAGRRSDGPAAMVPQAHLPVKGWKSCAVSCPARSCSCDRVASSTLSGACRGGACAVRGRLRCMNHTRHRCTTLSTPYSTPASSPASPLLGAASERAHLVGVEPSLDAHARLVLGKHLLQQQAGGWGSWSSVTPSLPGNVKKP